MASIITLLGGDTLSSSRADINTNFANLNTDKIEAADVTYDNLNTNGDVGTGATQVSQGDHTHSQLHDELHTIASHTDTTATGAELETLTDGSNADALHTHASTTTVPTIQVITASGTWTKPSGMVYAVVELVGGGGGGGSVNSSYNGSASGGGGGGYSRKIFDAATLAATETVTIGAGGAGGVGASFTSGVTGGTTKFADGKGYEISATGGIGGAISQGGNRGGDGGVGSGGDFNAAGDGGSGGSNLYNVDSSSGKMHSGKGGASFLGGGAAGFGAGANGNDANGTSAHPNGYGGGGGGGSSDSTNVNGGDGTDGVIIVTEYY